MLVNESKIMILNHNFTFFGYKVPLVLRSSRRIILQYRMLIDNLMKKSVQITVLYHFFIQD